MSGDFNRNWVPESPAAVGFAINRFLSEGDPEFATVLLVSEVLKGRFSVVVSALSNLSKIDEQGIKLLLSEPTVGSAATRIAYGLSGFSDTLYPLFSSCVDLVQETVRVTKSSLTPQVTGFLLDKVLALDDVRSLRLSDETVFLLRRQAGLQPNPNAAPDGAG